MGSHVQRLLLLWQPPKMVSHCALWHVNIALHHPWIHTLPQIHHLQMTAADTQLEMNLQLAACGKIHTVGII